MKTLTLTLSSGSELKLKTENTDGLLDAVSRQDVAFGIRQADDTVFYLNTRNLAGWSVFDPLARAAAQEAEAGPEIEPEVSESDSTEDTRTVAELKTDLEEGGVKYEAGAKKADLLKLALDNGL